MFVYVPIGYYNDSQDIIDLYPGGPFKGDEADIIVSHMNERFGNFHFIPESPKDPESFLTPKDVSESKCMVFTSDGKFAVSFSLGSYESLKKGSDMHGFYIDVYRLENRPDYDWYLKKLKEEESKADITTMETGDLLDYVGKLAKTARDGIAELKRRGYKF
jgi:hypothetical protein